MSDINSILETAASDGTVPFVVAMHGDASGINFTGAAGNAANGRPAGEDTVFRIFSMTKAIGSLAAMILVDRGKLSADTPVADVLPAWKDVKVLSGFDGEQPILGDPQVPATVRHLATHTSGMEYEFWNREVPEYMEKTGHPTILTGLDSSLYYPLVTEPGTRWGYGPSTDWLGQVVEAVDGRRVDAFCKEEIFEPLGMTSTAFEPDGLEHRLADVAIRGEDGAFAPMEIAPPSQPEFYGMGHALYSTAPDYMRFLRMILNKGTLDGNRILTETGVDTMLSDQMNGLKFETMHTVSPLTADVALDGDPAHSFMAVLHRADIPGKRTAGTNSWAGVLNTHYWVDPGKNLAAVIMTQTLPFVEPPFMALYDRFERAVYAG